MKLMSLIHSIRRIKGKTTNQKKVQIAREKIEASLGMFSKIHSDLEVANETLTNVIKEDTELIKHTQANIDLAQKEYESNKVLQKKIKTFIKE